MTLTKINVGILSVIAVAGGAVPLAVAAGNEGLTSHLGHTNGPQSPPSPAVAATPPAFHAEGVLEYDSVGAGNLLNSLVRRAFTVDVAGCRWRIASRALVPAADPAGEKLYIELTNSFDGIYKLTVFDGAKLRQANPAGAQNIELITETVEVVSGEVPFLDDSFATVPWLAYASSCFFQTNQERRVKQFLTMNRRLFDNKDVTIAVETHYTSTAPRLPDHIRFMNEGFDYALQEDGSVTRQPLGAPFDRGFEEASYTVEQFTTLSNITLPKVFQINYFATKPGTVSPQDRRLVSVIRGKMTSLSVSSGLPPSSSAGPVTKATEPDGNARRVLYVIDRRLGSPEQPLTYFTSGPVYQLGDPQLEVKEKIARIKRNKP